MLSVRQIGEGHRSSIGFRSVVVGARRRRLDRPPRPVHDRRHDRGRRRSTPSVFSGSGHRRRRRVRSDGCSTASGHASRRGQLTERLHQLEAQQDTRRDVAGTVVAADRAGVALLRRPVPGVVRARRARPHPGLRRRVERSRGRPVRALRRRRRHRHLLRDLHRVRRVGDRPAAPRRRPTSRPSPRSRCSAPAAANKGLALFPRRIGGRYHALSRCDGERNALAVSDDLRHWPTATPLDVADTDVELRPGSATAAHRSSSTRAGSCSPTASARCARTRSARSCSTSTTRPSSSARPTQPLITPRPDEQDGYVPERRLLLRRAPPRRPRSSSRSASPTAGSASPRSPSPTSSPPCATVPTARRPHRPGGHQPCLTPRTARRIDRARRATMLALPADVRGRRRPVAGPRGVLAVRPVRRRPPPVQAPNVGDDHGAGSPARWASCLAAPGYVVSESRSLKRWILPVAVLGAPRRRGSGAGA